MFYVSYVVTSTITDVSRDADGRRSVNESVRRSRRRTIGNRGSVVIGQTLIGFLGDSRLTPETEIGIEQAIIRNRYILK